MGEGEELTLGEDWVAFLITEVPLYTMILLSPLQALQKIHLANHMRCMANLLQADAVQQLESSSIGTSGGTSCRSTV